ncbi:hypothetical protein [Rhizobium laguerreae]|uniref:hypothetical protein n=1 Tax=Rhizobium laguerreae TaxID=1076926 RepID=UPI001C9189E3|nr:hypothetical protein [Rhizobium laguerreae]MBY3441604.1 hypothetical protein [Rhizobium laguerreae]
MDQRSTTIFNPVGRYVGVSTVDWYPLAALGFGALVLLLAFVRWFDPNPPTTWLPRKDAVDPPPSIPFPTAEHPVTPTTLQAPEVTSNVTAEPEREWLPGKGPQNQIIAIVDPVISCADVERRFIQVFAFTPDRGEALIGGVMKRKDCDRCEAMRIALWERDNEFKWSR